MKSNVPCPACADPEVLLIYSETSKLLHCRICGRYFVLDIVPNKKLLLSLKAMDTLATPDISSPVQPSFRLAETIDQDYPKRMGAKKGRHSRK